MIVRIIDNARSRLLLAAALVCALTLGACGEDTGTPILVRDGPAPIRTPVFDNIAGVVIYAGSYAITPSNARDVGQLTSCSLSGSNAAPLPMGVSLGADNTTNACLLSGDASALRAPSNTSLSITATNSAGSSDPLTFSILFGLAAPDLADAPNQLTFTSNMEITPLLFRNAGGPVGEGNAAGVASCIVQPALPAGLSIGPSANNTSCQITGTPSAVAARANYTITARNGRGSDAATASIEVMRPPPTAPDLADRAAVELVMNRPLLSEGIVFTNTGAAATGCAATGLPMGLSAQINTSGAIATCEIVGSATEGTPLARQITVTAMSMAGESDDANFILTVFAPPDVADLTGNAALNLRPSQPLASGVNLAFPATGGVISSCTANTQLPAGLTLAPFGNSCRIGGIPALAVASQDYTILASNAAGSDTATATITIENYAAGVPVIDDLPSSIVVLANQRIAQLYTFPSSGGSAGRCTVSPALPAGFGVLTIGNTCLIRGSPQFANGGSVAYTVTATNNAGDTDVATANIEVRPFMAGDPGIMDIAQTQRFTINHPISLQIPIVTGAGAPDSCQTDFSDSPLPSGMRVDALGNTCLIVGTPTAQQTPRSSRILAIKDGIISAARVNIAVEVPASTAVGAGP